MVSWGPGWDVLEPRDICCGFLWGPPSLRPLRRPIPLRYSTLADSPSREPTHPRSANVAPIVPGQFASRRGIISAHCHRLIESGTDRIVPAIRPACIHAASSSAPVQTIDSASAFRRFIGWKRLRKHFPTLF